MPEPESFQATVTPVHTHRRTHKHTQNIKQAVVMEEHLSDLVLNEAVK